MTYSIQQLHPNNATNGYYPENILNKGINNSITFKKAFIILFNAI